jgi:hypothetical protein
MASGWKWWMTQRKLAVASVGLVAAVAGLQAVYLED